MEKMTKDEIRKEYFRILNRYTTECERIAKEAKANGKLLPGLDANKKLFEKITAETNAEFERLRTQMLN